MAEHPAVSAYPTGLEVTISDDTDDFFSLPDGPPRDRWGRPLLIPAASVVGRDLATMRPDEKDELREPYTRASSLSDYLADFSHLWKWKMRYLARSLGQNSDLALLAASECYTTGFDMGDEKENRASGRRLDDIIERALDRGKISEKADYGTAIHAFTEPGNDGHTDNQRAINDTDSFWTFVNESGCFILGTELFTANDALRVAGTFDHLMFVPGYGIVITDKKTSKDVHGEDFRIQLATYANADLYDWETDQRITLEEFIKRQGWDPDLLDRTKGLIFHIKDGKTEIWELDLAAGLVAAQHAVWVRDHHRKGTHKRRVTDKILKAKADLEVALERWISDAPDEQALGTLWSRWGKNLWSDRHTKAAKARKESL
jgi:hypothetical protein